MNALADVESCVIALLADTPFVAVDIGARGDIPAPWRVLDGIADFLCFEADRDACNDLRTIYDARGHGNRYRIFPIALTGDGGQRTLYRTRAPGGSSLFDPDTSLIRAYTDADYLYPIRREQIETVAALPIFRQIGNSQLDLVKLDIQGCELDVLKSLGHEYLAQTVMVEVEASMVPRNVDYPTFCDLHRYMAHHNFALLDLWPDRQHRARSGRRAGYLEDMFGVWTRSPSVSARIWEVDALFVRDSDQVVESGNVAQLRKLLVCLCVYGFFAEAAYAVEAANAHGLVSRSDCDDALQAVITWHRFARYRRRYGTGVLGQLYRRMLGYLNIPPSITGADYIHRPS